MNIKEWALILFTILTQMAVGAFLVLGIIRLYVTRKAGVEEADRMSDRILIAIVGAVGLGMLFSLLHLSNPLGAPWAVTNVATSWLSREIVASAIFALLGVIYLALQWFKVGSSSLRNGIALLTALEGIGFVLCQAKAYMLPVQTSWNTLATPVTFCVTTLLLGVLAVGAALVANTAIIQKENPDRAEQQYELLRGIIRWVALASIVLLGIEMVVTPVYLAYLSTAGDAALTSLGLIAGQYNLVFILRMALVILGAGIMAFFLYQNACLYGKQKEVTRYTYFAFTLVLAAEVLGRFVFYATQYRIGI